MTISKERSTCCEGFVFEDYFHDYGAREYNRRWGVNIPAYKDLTLCNSCHQECEVTVILEEEEVEPEELVEESVDDKS